jgi:hypothetical protein
MCMTVEGLQSYVQVIIEIIEGFVLQCKEEGSSELHRSSILCKEGFGWLCVVT